MGKNKQVQRTKNNARPSNSSRSAELLGSTPNFIGFSAVKDGGYIPVLPGLSLSNLDDVEMNSVDSNFQIVLRKMNKKDPVTRCKALQEFATLCQESEFSAVEGMLPFWPRLYSTLATDVEHRVREAAQLAHAAVVKRSGRSIAMYLKQLAGPWFTSQYDTYAPVASAATNSFNETFPAKKMVDAIVHCQREILSYICDNITVHTAQTLSTQKTLTAEEMEVKYQKVLISNLLAYSFYFKKVSVNQIEETLEIHQKIVTNAKFWKLAKHEVVPIKAAFFNVLTSIIENCEKVLADEKKRTVTSIMNCLDETEPALLAAVWESMLVAVTKIEDWYLVVNVEKLVLPKLCRVLRSGGQCCAAIIYPNLLPLISQFPKLNMDKKALYSNFFSNMRSGFLAKHIQLNRSEMLAVITSFAECLRYTMLLYVDDVTFCEKLLKEQLVPFIELCMVENTFMRKPAFCEVTHLVRYWSKNRYKEEYKSYHHIMQELWKELKALYDKLIHNFGNSSLSTSEVNNSQIELLLTFKNAPSHGRKNLKVKFSEPKKEDTTCQLIDSKVSSDTNFDGELNDFVNSVSVAYFNKINESRSKEHVVHLNKLIAHFDSKALFVALSNTFKMESNFLEFYKTVLKNWLHENTEETPHIVELIFNFIRYMNDSDKEEVLKSLEELNDISLRCSIIQCALSKRNRNDLKIKKWCMQPQATALLTDVASQIASNDCSELNEKENLIVLAFETDENGNLLISEEAINRISEILCNSLQDRDESMLQNITYFISRLVPLTWTHKTLTDGDTRMLETLFDLCTKECCNNNDLISFEKVCSTWRKGYLLCKQRLSQSKFLQLTTNLAAILWQKVYSSDDTYNKDGLVNIAADLMEVVITDTIDAGTDVLKEILSSFLVEPNVYTWLKEVIAFVIRAEVITGNLYVSDLCQRTQIFQKTVCINIDSTVFTDYMERCLKWALFNINVLNNLFPRLKEYVETEEMNYLSLPGITDMLINIIYISTVGDLYTLHYKFTRSYSNICKILAHVIQDYTSLQTYLTDNLNDQVLYHLQKNHKVYDNLLPYVIRFYCGKLRLPKNSVEHVQKSFIDSVIADSDNQRQEIYLQIIQVLSAYREMESVLSSASSDINALIVSRAIIQVQQTNNSTYIDTLERISSLQKENSVLLYDCDVSDAQWERMAFTLEVIRLLTELVKAVPTVLRPEQWDFVLISLALWQLSVSKSKQNVTNFKVAALATAVSQLFCAVQTMMQRHEETPIENLPSTLLDEWKNVFVGDIQAGIVQIWMLCADLCNPETALASLISLDIISQAISIMDGKSLFNEQFNKAVTIKISLDDTIKSSLEFLQSSLPNVQLGAYHVIKHTISELVCRDKALIESENFDIETLNIKKLEEIVTSTGNIVNTILMDFKLCDMVSCTIQPFTDSYTYTLGYLFTWALILDMCASAHCELRSQYAEILKNDLLPSLLNNIFRLMPVKVYQDYKKEAVKLSYFSTTPSLDFRDGWTEEKLDHIACWLYTNSVRYLPVLVRQWWSTADTRVSTAVDKITTNYVSPLLCQELFNNKISSIENMQVKVHPIAREVVALYQMDDTKLELNIVLPPNHPLGPIAVYTNQHAGVATNWKHCHMQLSIFLIHQNGSVWDGLLMWKRTLDKKFAGVEECYICFSIFHMSTHQIPKLSCHTCRKKFHTPCLYKWFNTSQKSTCPICRNVF